MNHLTDAWPCHRLWLESKATRTELETFLSIDDVADMNEALDAWQEAQRKAEARR